MTLVLETGTGVPGANSYVNSAFVTDYLTSLNRQTENSWDSLTQAQTDAHCIAATQYIDTRWGPTFAGQREVKFDGSRARALISVAAQPADGDTLTVSVTQFSLVATPDDFNLNEIPIGADVAETRQNIINAINNDGQAEANLREGTAAQILLLAPVEGASFNDMPLTATSTQITVDAGFQNGLDSGEQPLEFPRTWLYDSTGKRVYGVPLRLKQAAAEYAVRSAANSLYSDPVVDDSGRIVQEKMEKVGPIEESTAYAEGASLELLIKPYPAADRLLKQYLVGGGKGGVTR